MNKRIITGAVIALAAGIAAYIYKRKRNKLSTAAEDAYDTMNDTLYAVEEKTESVLS
ncbi:MAG: hypothetical protein JO072_00135 [Parafilimonas sp.]|nr:hypothetical protein [Parafilimonas sp.]